MNLGYILRRIRTMKKYSLSMLAAKTGLSKSSLSNIENGKNNPTVDTLDKICEALDVSSTNVIELANELDRESKAKYIDGINMLDYDLDDMIKNYIIDKKPVYQFKFLVGEDENSEQFKDAESAIQFILSQPCIMGFGGFDINSLSDEDKIAFANDLLAQIEFLGYKYGKKKNK